MTTFTKHQNHWAVKGSGLHAGQLVTVTKKDGTTKHVTVTAILATVNGQQVCSFKDNATVASQGHHHTHRAHSSRIDHEDCLSFAHCLHSSPNCPYHH